MFPERILEGCTKYIKDFIRVFYQTSGWEYAEIMAFEQSILEELDIDNVEKYASAIDPIPWEHRTQSVTNQISRASSLFRDEYIFEQIAKGLQQYKKVFVVYGSAHAVKQEPAFRAFLASK
jgi:cephalosporin hydroxylase